MKLRMQIADIMAEDLHQFLAENRGRYRGEASSIRQSIVSHVSAEGGHETDDSDRSSKPSSSSRVVRVVPKGLRSFNEHDADFFLDLLPGPKDKNGLPALILFWKTQIEERDPDPSA